MKDFKRQMRLNAIYLRMGIGLAQDVLGDKIKKGSLKIYKLGDKLENRGHKNQEDALYQVVQDAYRSIF